MALESLVHDRVIGEDLIMRGGGRGGKGISRMYDCKALALEFLDSATAAELSTLAS